MLELAKAGSSGCARGETPVLRNGSVVAVLRVSGWREAATAVVADREWVFDKRSGRLRGRWATEPEDAARLSAARTAFWSNTWALDLEGRSLEVRRVSVWKPAHRVLSDGLEVAVTGSTGGWSRRPTLDADDSLPLHQQVFLLWMELVLRRRNDAAIGAGTTAAVIGGTG